MGHQSPKSPMAKKKAFPLRVDANIWEAMRRWSDDELRSVNAQIEYVIRDALRKAGRLPLSKRQEDQEPQTISRSGPGPSRAR